MKRVSRHDNKSPERRVTRRTAALLPNQRAYLDQQNAAATPCRDSGDTSDSDEANIVIKTEQPSSSTPARFQAPRHDIVSAWPSTGTSADGPKERLQFSATCEGRDVDISVTPSGVLVCECARPLDPTAETFYHYTTVPSWRVVRASSGSKRGVAIGLALTLDDHTEVLFSTGEGKEIGNAMMRNVQGLADIMHGGMHVRGTAMVN